MDKNSEQPSLKYLTNGIFTQNKVLLLLFTFEAGAFAQKALRQNWHNKIIFTNYIANCCLSKPGIDGNDSLITDRYCHLTTCKVNNLGSLMTK